MYTIYNLRVFNSLTSQTIAWISTSENFLQENPFLRALKKSIIFVFVIWEFIGIVKSCLKTSLLIVWNG
ncbi:MAG: hypothetical protein EBS13_09395 [Verrucomicrobia bacterium]|nr:hypothetical protein [Verrucomicrobiota bacterium]